MALSLMHVLRANSERERMPQVLLWKKSHISYSDQWILIAKQAETFGLRYFMSEWEEK
jgi:hypothetical protein